MRSLPATHTWSLISSPPTFFGLPWEGVPPSATARLCRPQATWPQHPWTGQPPQATHCQSPVPCRVNSVPCCARGQKGVAGQGWQVLSVNSHSLGADGGPSKKRGDSRCPKAGTRSQGQVISLTEAWAGAQTSTDYPQVIPSSEGFSQPCQILPSCSRMFPSNPTSPDDFSATQVARRVQQGKEAQQKAPSRQEPSLVHSLSP